MENLKGFGVCIPPTGYVFMAKSFDALWVRELRLEITVQKAHLGKLRAEGEIVVSDHV